MAGETIEIVAPPSEPVTSDNDVRIAEIEAAADVEMAGIHAEARAAEAEATAAIVAAQTEGDMRQWLSGRLDEFQTLLGETNSRLDGVQEALSVLATLAIVPPAPTTTSPAPNPSIPTASVEATPETPAAPDQMPAPPSEPAAESPAPKRVRRLL